MKTLYLDNNATTMVAPEVLEVMLPYFSELYGNPSSMHTFGGQLHKKVEEARARVAQLIGADPDEIIFTSCGTESDNTAIMSAVDKRFYGVASGMNGTMRLLGQMLSMGIASMIFAIVIGRVEITSAFYPQFITSVHYAFVLFTILCIAGIYASYARGNTH